MSTQTMFGYVIEWHSERGFFAMVYYHTTLVVIVGISEEFSFLGLKYKDLIVFQELEEPSSS